MMWFLWMVRDMLLYLRLVRVLWMLMMFFFRICVVFGDSGCCCLGWLLVMVGFFGG